MPKATNMIKDLVESADGAFIKIVEWDRRPPPFHGYMRLSITSPKHRTRLVSRHPPLERCFVEGNDVLDVGKVEHIKLSR